MRATLILHHYPPHAYTVRVSPCTLAHAQVGFLVYSDLAQYQSGVYRRSVHAKGPLGGHAVKLIGYGVNVDPSGGEWPYWLAVNSWSPAWGDGGTFKIARGSNECSIESTPAAGMPRVPRDA